MLGRRKKRRERAEREADDWAAQLAWLDEVMDAPDSSGEATAAERAPDDLDEPPTG